MRKQVIDLRLLLAVLGLVLAAGIVALLVSGGTSKAKPQAGQPAYESAGVLTPIRATTWDSP